MLAFSDTSACARPCMDATIFDYLSHVERVRCVFRSRRRKKTDTPRHSSSEISGANHIELPPAIAAKRSRAQLCRISPRPVEMVTAGSGRSIAVRNPAI